MCWFSCFAFSLNWRQNTYCIKSRLIWLKRKQTNKQKVNKISIVSTRFSNRKFSLKNVSNYSKLAFALFHTLVLSIDSAFIVTHKFIHVEVVSLSIWSKLTMRVMASKAIINSDRILISSLHDDTHTTAFTHRISRISHIHRLNRLAPTGSEMVRWSSFFFK